MITAGVSLREELHVIRFGLIMLGIYLFMCWTFLLLSSFFLLNSLFIGSNKCKKAGMLLLGTYFWEDCLIWIYLIKIKFKGSHLSHIYEICCVAMITIKEMWKRCVSLISKVDWCIKQVFLVDLLNLWKVLI